ncbi:alpha/beta fold hydrolase [Nonomuraea rubra]
MGGLLVRAYRAGAGAELVLLHGGGPDDARRAWEPVWAALAGRARVTAPDLPGFGGTPLGATVPTLAGYAAWLGAFLDACGIERAVIAGRSLGGWIALRAALDLPHRVSRVAVCGTRTRLVGRLGGVTCPVLVLGDPPGRDAEKLAAFLPSAPAPDR